MMENKRGIGLLIATIIALGVVVLILGIFALVVSIFSPTFRMFLLGGGILLIAIPLIAQQRLTGARLGLIAVFVVIGGALLFFGTQQTFAAFSISDVQIEGDGDRILIFARVGGGQEFAITFGPSSLNGFIQNDGFQATDSVRLSAEYVESSKDFRFFTSTSNINTVKNIERLGDITIFTTNRLAACQESWPTTTNVVDEGVFARFGCYGTRNIGDINSFTGGESGGFAVRFTLDGETATVTEDVRSVTMAGGRAIINWQGNLLEVNNIGAPNAQVFRTPGAFVLVNENALSNINDGFQNYQSCTGTSIIPLSQLNSCRGVYSSVVSNNLRDIGGDYIDIEANAVDFSFSQGVFMVDLSQPVFVPTFTIELDADLVKLVKLAGEPRINSCLSNQDFDVAGSKSASAVVSNVGDDEGFFDFRVECSNPDMTGSAPSLDIPAGASRTVNIQLAGGNTGQDINEASCSLTVTDRGSGSFDSCGFEFDVQPGKFGECVAGQRMCGADGFTLFTCVGDSFQPTSCQNGCQDFGGAPQCLPGPDEPEPPALDELRKACETKAARQPLLGWTFTETVRERGFFEKITSFDFSDFEVTGECKASFVPFYVGGGVILLLGIFITILVFRNRDKKRRKK